MRARQVVRVGAVGFAAVALVVLAACEPIAHPTSSVRESATSAVTFEQLSGDGHYAVVRATGAGATVPGAGRWRVDRTSGSSVALPASDRVVDVSRAGDRILLGNGNALVLWTPTTTRTPPVGAVFSDQLTYALFVAADGSVQRWDASTGATTPVETGASARPAQATQAIVAAVSDDGSTAQYTLRFVAQRPVERFANLATGVVVDVTHVDGPSTGFGYLEDRFVLAATGAGFLHTYEYGDFDLEARRPAVSWAELVALPSGEVLTHYGNTTGESIQRAVVAADGGRAWVYQTRRNPGTACGFDTETGTCLVASHAVAFWGPNGRRSFDLFDREVGNLAADRNARLLLIDREQFAGFGLAPKGPVEVLDAFATGSGVEVLPATPSSVAGRVTDNLRLVATTSNSGKGWYEYAAAP